MPDSQPHDARSSLPPVYKGQLDEARLRALFADLATLTETQHIQIRDSNGHAAPEPHGLDDLFQLLASGTIRSAQIRYRLDGTDWCDTLLVQSGFMQLIRIQQDRTPADS